MSDPTRPRNESVVEQQIRLAQERGDFDNLPGRGKPLPGLHDPPDDLWWVRGLLRREGLSSELLLPPSVQLRKEIDRLPDTVRALPTEQAVREAVAELNLRIVEFLRAPAGPRVPVGRVNADEAVQRWLAERAVAEHPAERPAPAEPAPAPWWRRIARRA